MSKKLNNLQIVAIVGLAGAGKSEVVDYVTQKSIPKVYFGGVILQAVQAAGLDITPENEHMMREKLRREEGNDVVVKRIITQISELAEAGQKRIVADGLYSWTEYKALKHAFPGSVELIAVVAPRFLRYRRLAQRPHRPLTHEEAETRDWSEIENLEKGGPIAIADHFIINDGSIDSLHATLDDILATIGFTD